MSYAKTTTVPISRSRDEIEKTLTRYGVEAFAYLRRGDNYVVQFERAGRAYRFPIEAGETDQETRRRWRVALLWIKGAMEAISAEVVTFEACFGMWTALPDGSTVGEKFEEQIAVIKYEGRLPRLEG